MNPLLNWLATVPNVIWSGLLASTVTLAGVLIADWRNTLRQRRQHNFDAEQAKIDRTMDIRREVYLPVAAALSKVQAFIFSLANEKPSPEINPITEFAEACAKLAMVSTTETAILAQQLAADYSSAYMKLMYATTAINAARSSAETHKELKEKASAEFDRVTLEISKFLETAGSNKAIFEALRRSQQSFLDQKNTQARLEAAALREVAVEYTKYSRDAMNLIVPLSEASIPVLVRIRTELGQDTDVDALVYAMRESREKNQRELLDFLDRLEASLSDEQT